jgi:hypothetical protein
MAAHEPTFREKVLAGLREEIEKRYAHVPGFTAKPYYQFPDHALELTSPGKFSTIGWHPERPDGSPLEVYLSGGPLGWSGNTFYLELANPAFHDQLYHLLDGHHV